MELHPLVAGFDGIAEQYELGRPGYPEHVARAIADAAGGPLLVDVGAGTGKLAGPLAALGREVIAVDPIATMRTVLGRAIGPENVRAGTAEALPLDDASVDGAVSSDAWHWFDGDRAAAELHRVVRPGGGIVICELVPTGAASERWAGVMRDVLEPLRQAMGHPLAKFAEQGREGLQWTPPGFDGGGFAPFEHRADLDFVHHTDRARMVAHAASISFVGSLPPDRRHAVLAELDAGLRDAGIETAAVPYCALLWITRRLP